ncbi:LPS-assembly protein LptD [Lacihabitans sp. LS3-19]|uniref:putative LPS assembly protein LptD n=1 Tax=Lacihabitans sp. LS3-19 TaxID=2487335 RepID=UPI0020CC1C87|nr:putative LPS assembly protein LptD [Lacihabitans sp. LS3-19]MCP9767328.1 LPS-assembly protein LptD [Lacihabitans sp. LS3-19]
MKLKLVLLFIFGWIVFAAQAQRPLPSIGGRNFGSPSNAQNTSSNNTNSQQNSKQTSKFNASKKNRIKRDSLSVVIPDSLKSLENQLETTVETFSSDSTVLDIETQQYHLYGDAQVIYGEIQLKADYIMLDWGKSEVFAHGMPDTTKKNGPPVKGKPVFVDGAESYNSDTVRYNFKSKKAIVSNIVTVQGDGFVQGKVVKKDPQDNMYLANAKYTTCDLAEPHFHIAAKKIKLVNKKSLISGPFNIVLADIPLPIGLPFGFFPIPKKKEIGTSGFIMGSYGEQRRDNRGLYFKDFGYYHAFNEYISAKLIGQVYTYGSYGVGLNTQYSKKYKYGGDFNVQFNHNVAYSSNGLDTTRSNQFNIRWSHSPRSLRPDRSFSSSMDIVSSGFNNNNRNSSDVQNLTKNNFGGTISYMRNFGKLVTTNSSFRVDQSSSSFRSTLGYSFGIKQFNPFVPEKKQIGNWYESFRVGLDVSGGVAISNAVSSRSTSYTDYNIAGIDNKPLSTTQQRRITELQYLLNDPNVSTDTKAIYQKELEKLQSPVLKDWGDILKNNVINTSYIVPIVLPNFKIARYLNLTPSISYRGDIYTKELKYQYVNPTNEPVTFTKNNGKLVTVSLNPTADSIQNVYADNGDLNVLLNPNSGGVVIVDTISKPSFGQTTSFGTSMNTRLYGTYRFGDRGKIKEIRHTVVPSINLNYTPSSEGQYTSKVQVRSDSVFRFLPRFLNGGGSSGSASGNVGFSLTNQLEAKVRNKSDTAENVFEKINLLNNLSLGGGYNLLAKKEFGEFALSNINISASTSLFKNLINVNANGSLDPYAYEVDELVKSNLAGKRVNTFKWKYKPENGVAKADYLSSFNFSLNSTFSPETFKKDKATPAPGKDPAKDAMNQYVQANPLEYVDFNIPWSIGLSYTFNYNKQGLSDARITQTVSVNGDFSLTPKFKFTYNTGWDFEFKQITLTNIGIIRELHCWSMSMNWTPISGSSIRGGGFNFTLQPKSALLRDLKLTKRRVGNY